MNMTLAERYMPLAESMARARSKYLPANITIDDVKSAAFYGLTDAASKYDSGKGVPFHAYAKSRISGEITDFFRRAHYDCSEPEDIVSASLPDMVQTDDFFDFVSSQIGEADGKMLRMYYVDGRSLKEVGEARGVGEARACQILKSCHLKLKKRLKKGCVS